MTLINIANTPQYQLQVSKEKNRAYLKIIGFWRSPEQVPHYVADWEKAIEHLEPGFTVLTDATEMKIHPAVVGSLHEKAQESLIGAGVSKVAELPMNEITEVQLDILSDNTKMPKAKFSSREEAERWLDEK